MTAIAGELVNRDGLLDLAKPEPGELPPPRLLGAFDPLLLGWVSREPILGRYTGVVTVNGIFRPFALVRGRAVATWRLPAGRVDLEPIAPLPRRVEKALEADAVAVERFLGVRP